MIAHRSGKVELIERRSLDVRPVSELVVQRSRPSKTRRQDVTVFKRQVAEDRCQAVVEELVYVLDRLFGPSSPHLFVLFLLAYCVVPWEQSKLECSLQHHEDNSGNSSEPEVGNFRPLVAFWKANKPIRDHLEGFNREREKDADHHKHGDEEGSLQSLLGVMRSPRLF